MNYSAELDEETLAYLRDHAVKFEYPLQNAIEAAQNIARHLPDVPGKTARLIWCMENICAHGRPGATDGGSDFRFSLSRGKVERKINASEACAVREYVERQVAEGQLFTPPWTP